MGMNPHSAPYRYTVLLCACFLIFGNYFVYDLPGALSQTIKEQIPDPFNPGEPRMSQASLNLMYSVYNFPNIVLAMMGGIFVDRLGLRTGCFVFVSIILLGQCVVALGASAKNYWVMLAGRVIFAVGGESSAVAQNAFVSRWFKGRELALALGLALSLGRLGSGLNFLTAAQIASAFGDAGLSVAMWFAVILCGISEISCLILIMLDRKAEKMGVLKDANDAEPEQISFRAVREFPASFWVICSIVVSFYSAVFPFNAVAVGMLSDPKSNYINVDTKEALFDETTAGYIVSIPSFLAVFLAPLMGRLVDKVGRRPTLIGTASLLLALAHSLFAFTYSFWSEFQPWTRYVLHPVVIIVVYGVAYGLLAAALFPCCPLVISNMSFIGTAFGIIFSIQNGGLTVTNFLMGMVQDKLGPVAVELFFVGFAVTSLMLAVVLHFLDARAGGILNSISHSQEKEVSALAVNDEDEEHSADDMDQLIRADGRHSYPRRSRISYDFTDLPSAQEVISSHSRVCNGYLRKIGIVGLEGRMRSASAM